MLTFTRITSSVKQMDETYDANFGEWIKNEENAKIIGFKLRIYVNEYDKSKLIIVVKWIVKDWTLRSIISLIKKMLIDVLIEKRIIDKKIVSIIAGLVYTWNVIFIGEFLLAIFKMLDKVEFKIKFVGMLLKDFDKDKINELLNHIKPKVDEKIAESILKCKRNGNMKQRKILESYRLN